MKVVILAGGMISDDAAMKQYIQSDDFIICADSGYDHAVRMGVHPDLVVGDMDSVQNQVDGQNTMVYPAKKEFTDTELAVQIALEKKPTELVLIAATGTRLDHTLANILLLRGLVDKKIKATIVDAHNQIQMTNDQLVVQGSVGDLLSLIPVSDCMGVTTQNLEYPLVDTTLPFGPSRGVSNVMTDVSATVTIKNGYLLVIKSTD